MSQIQLLKDVKSQCGNIFAKGSTIEVLTKASKKDPSVEIYPVMAWDEEKLEYPVNNRLYTLSLKSTDYKEVADVAMNKMAFGLPGSQTSEEDSEDIMALSKMFEDKSVTWNMDGEVTKKAELEKDEEKEDEKEDEKEEDKKEEKTAKKVTAKEENNITETDAEITTDFDASVGGSGTVTDCYSEDLGNFEVQVPLMGKINQLKNLLKKSVSEDNNVTDSKDTITTDFDSGIDGSSPAWSDSDLPKADEKALEAKPPILGEL